MGKVLVLIIILTSFTLGSCGLMVPRPKLELSMAAAAFMAAKNAKANVNAPASYRKAEHYYLKAKSAYKKKYFNKAKQYAILSQRFSERAELTAQLNKLAEDY